MITYDNTTLHGSLKLHLSRHVYKRGKNKGDAPAGPRGKTHYRVIDRGTHMAVRFWNTDIVKAYPDGSITIDCDGYAGRPTTKTHLNRIMPRMWWVASYRLHSQSQLVIRTPKGKYRYYDGISFDAEGTPTTELKPFYARRVDKDQVAELNKDMEENGFKEMFKVLWGQAKPEDMRTNSQWRWENNLFSLPEVHANKWLNMVAYFAFTERWGHDVITGNYKKLYTKRDPSHTWSHLMRWCKRDMFNVVETEVYSLK